MNDGSAQGVDLLTCAEAAEILGMTESGTYKLISRGILTRRHNGRRDRGRTGIVARAQVEQVAADRARAAAEHKQRMTEREAARGRVRETTGQYVVDEDGTWQWAPPDSDHEWLNTEQAAQLIGITSQAIAKRCRKGTIPAVRVGTKWWVRADHARIAANVRATGGPEDVATALADPAI